MLKHAKGTARFMHSTKFGPCPRQTLIANIHLGLSTPNEIAARFAAHPATASSNPEVSEVFLHLIPIQILASCYALSHLPHAASLPSSLYLSKREPELITSLRLHTQFRYCPAAGHHACNSSRDSSWPGLYSGPSLEDQLVEEMSCRRLLKKRELRANESESTTTSLKWSRDLTNQ